jgi:AbrB family looped-hinge helix DNA binding protein
MHEYWASVTERGQVTIPAEVRAAMGLQGRGKVTFLMEDGHVVMRKVRPLTEVFGSVPALKTPMSWSEMQEIAHEEVAQDVVRGMRRK